MGDKYIGEIIMDCKKPNLYNSYFNYGNIDYYNKINAALGIINNEVPVNTEYGYLELYVTKNLGKDIATDAVVTIYARQGDEFHIPVEKVVIVNNPTIIELPIAHKLGNLIKGPEYYFTTYNLTIESEGYYKVTTLNIRLFPEIKASFFYNLNKIVQGIPIDEKVTNIPPHPRDEIINNNISLMNHKK